MQVVYKARAHTQIWDRLKIVQPDQPRSMRLDGNKFGPDILVCSSSRFVTNQAPEFFTTHFMSRSVLTGYQRNVYITQWAGPRLVVPASIQMLIRRAC